MTEHCPTCGATVRIVRADEGTHHYEPVGAEKPASQLTRWVKKNQHRANDYYHEETYRILLGLCQKIDALIEKWGKYGADYALAEIRDLMKETPGG